MAKNRLFLLLTAFAAVGLIAGCGLFGPGEQPLVVGGGYINGYVETQDGAPLEGVTVNYSVPDEPATAEEETAETAAYATKGTQFVVTDAAGFFEINELIPGDYRLTFTISGYTLGTDVVRLTPEGFFLVSEVATEGETENAAARYEYTDEIIVTLYAKIATASGTVFAETATGRAPAEGQVVVAKFQDRYFYSATVDANGMFSFSGLPAGPVAFYARSYYDGTVFYDNLWLTTSEEWDPVTESWVDILTTADLSDRDEALGEAYWEPGSGTTPYVTSGNISQNFPVTQSIELTFNKPIITSDFLLKATGPGGEVGGDMGLLADGDPIDFSESWDATNTTVTLDPSETLRSDYNYTVSYTVGADHYYTGRSVVSFRTERGIAKIGSNVEDLDDIALEDFAVSDSIVITFNMAIDHIFATEIALQDSDLNFIYITPAITGTDSNVLTIDPSLDLESNESYTVSWTVYSALDNGTDADTGTVTFSTAEEALAQPATVMGFTSIDSLTDPTGAFVADWNSTSIFFQWDRVLDADGDEVDAYVIYATDTVNGVEEILVAEEPDPGPEDYSTTLTGTADLSASVFDAWPDADDLVQPFAQYNAITFTIYAYVTDAAGEEVLMSTTADTFGPIVDTTVPTFGAVAALDPAGTTVATPEPLFGEAAYTAEVDETWTIIYANISEAIDPDFTVTVDTVGLTGTSPPAVEWTWGPQEVTIEVIFTAGDDIAAGDTLQITIEDTSNNQRVIVFDF